MSNLTRLEAVSDALDTAISTANSLPDAGGGGGGGVETCTVSVESSDGPILRYCATISTNGTIDSVVENAYGEPSIVIENAVKGSVIAVVLGSFDPSGLIVTNATVDDDYQIFNVDGTCVAFLHVNN